MKEQPSGSFSPPPPGAPIERTEPIQDQALQEMLRKARANERTLAPLKGPSERPPGPEPPIISPPAAELAPAVPSAPPRPDHPSPAASDSDSPSRGIPQPITDPGKVITGGFGDVGEAQYYPLDGSELREVVRMCLDELNERLERDLRFHPAVTYPRARIKVIIEVEGWAEDAGFRIERVRAPEKQTPIEVARAHGAEEVAFVLAAVRQEFDAAGQPESPPDRLRDELGLPKPHKRMISVGAQQMFVDVVPDGELF